MSNNNNTPLTSAEAELILRAIGDVKERFQGAQEKVIFERGYFKGKEDVFFEIEMRLAQLRKSAEFEARHNAAPVKVTKAKAKKKRPYNKRNTEYWARVEANKVR